MSSENGHQEAVKLLLAKGAKVDQANNDGDTPLSVSSQNGHLEVVKLLLANGKKVNQAEGGEKEEEEEEEEVRKCLECDKEAGPCTRFCSRECQFREEARRAEEAKEEREEGEPKRKVRVCENCSKVAETMQKCSRCRLARYCSEECQLEDWKEHKKSCMMAAARKKGGKGT